MGVAQVIRRKLDVVAWLVRSLVRHWDLMSQMVATDLRGRYVGSNLGLFWSVIHPFVMIGIYTIVFSRVMGARLEGVTDRYAYGIYLCAALLPWLAFQEVIARTTTLFPDNANLVRKMAFPKAILYGAVTLSSAVNFTLALGVFLLILRVSGHPIHPTSALWLPFAALQLAFGLGLGIITSVVHVFVRDTAQVVSVLLQLWFWATPIAYVETVLPHTFQRAEALNPLYLFCAMHRDVLLYGRVPSAHHIEALVVLTAAILIAGLALYRRFRSDILDEL